MDDRLIIERNYCAAILNFYINHSHMRPFLYQDTDPEYVDASGILALPSTYFFTFPGGGLLFWASGDNNYEADLYFLPRKRGAIARQAAKEALSTIFSLQNPPEAVKASAPRFNAKSRHFIVGLGFKRTGISPSAFLKDGVRHDVVHFEIERKAWEALSGQ